MRKNFTFVSTILATSVMLISILASPSESAWSDAQTSVSVFGGAGSDGSNSIAVDSSGNVYTTGNFAGTVDFDPGAGTANLTSVGSNEIFVSKINSSGNYVWAKKFGGVFAADSISIAVDSSSNVYIAGSFRSEINFDPTVERAKITSAGGDDIFVAKLNSSGDAVWSRSLGGPEYDYPTSIAVDKNGNVYTTGSFAETADFNPAVQQANLTSAGRYDVFISKLNSDGNYVWAKRIGGEEGEYGNSLALDSSGNVYTTGQFRGTVDFDPGADTEFLTVNGGMADDVFVSKLNSDGNYVWAKNFGGESSDYSVAMAVDNRGNVYTTGYFYGTGDFNPGEGTANLTSAGNNDVFISKLNSEGIYVWAKSLGGMFEDMAYSIKVDGSGNVYTSGIFEGTSDFDPSSLTSANLTSLSEIDAFISKLDADGNYSWAKQLGVNSDYSGTGIAIDKDENVYSTGLFFGTVDFNPNSGSANFSSAGDSDIYILKLNSLGSAAADYEDAQDAAQKARNSAAAAEAARKQRELTEILSLIPSIAGLSTNISELTNSLLFKQKCVKGKKAKYVKYGAKCPKGYTKKK